LSRAGGTERVLKIVFPNGLPFLSFDRFRTKATVLATGFFYRANCLIKEEHIAGATTWFLSVARNDAPRYEQNFLAGKITASTRIKQRAITFFAILLRPAYSGTLEGLSKAL